MRAFIQADHWADIGGGSEEHGCASCDLHDRAINSGIIPPLRAGTLSPREHSVPSVFEGTITSFGWKMRQNHLRKRRVLTDEFPLAPPG